MQTKADLVAIVNAAPAFLDVGERQSHEVVSALTILIDDNLWSLEEYFAWMARGEEAQTAAGWTVFAPVRDLVFWAERGILTASDYAEYLDAECAREERKEAMYY